MTRVEQCEGFELLRLRGANRWAVYEDTYAMGCCEECGARLVGRFRIETRHGLARYVCPSHPIDFVIPSFSALSTPRPGSWGAHRLDVFMKELDPMSPLRAELLAMCERAGLEGLAVDALRASVS